MKARARATLNALVAEQVGEGKAVSRIQQDENTTLKADAKPVAFVLFGATGDDDADHSRAVQPPPSGTAARRRHHRRFRAARQDDAGFREDLRANMKEFAPKLPSDGPEWDAFANSVFYHRSTFNEQDGYKRLAVKLAELDKTHAASAEGLYYLATPPDNFSEIIANLGEAGLDKPGRERMSRVLSSETLQVRPRNRQEAQRGSSPSSAKSRYTALTTISARGQIAEHPRAALRKPDFRAGSGTKYIDNVQIVVAETLGVEGAADTSSSPGSSATRIVQNHSPAGPLAHRDGSPTRQPLRGRDPR